MLLCTNNFSIDEFLEVAPLSYTLYVHRLQICDYIIKFLLRFKLLLLVLQYMCVFE